MNYLDGYEKVSGRRGWTLYRKIVNGIGKWKAKNDTNDFIKDITYEQALGYEPIDDTEAFEMWLGKQLGLRTY